MLAERARRAGPDRGDRPAGQRARVEAGLGQPREQLVRSVRRGDAHEVVARQIRQLGRDRRDTDRGRLDHLRAELAQPRGQRARLRPGAGDGDRAPVQRPRLEPGQGVAQLRHRTDDRDGRRADARRRRPLRDVLQRRHHRPLPGQRPALDDRDRLARRPAARHQPLGDPRQRAHPHVEHQRAGERGERRPVERAVRLGRILVTGDEGHAGGQLAMRDRDAGVGRRGDARRDAGHRPRSPPPPRGRRAPPRRRARTRTGRRPSAGPPDARRDRARRAAGRSPPGASAARRPPCRRRRSRRRSARPPAPRAG